MDPNPMANEDQSLIRRTFVLAEQALLAGERPVGAVLVRDGTVVSEASDAVFALRDPTAHAELRLISDYCQANGLHHLRGYDLFCFIEPCLMCCGAIHWAKIRRVVYALPQERLNHLSGGRLKPGSRTYLATGNRIVEVVGPIEEEAAFAIAEQYPWQGSSQ